MTEYQKKVKLFYEDRRNWRPPSLAEVAKFMGRSKSAAHKMLKKIRENETKTY